MSRQKRPILEIVTSATRQVVKKFKTVTGNLSAPPLGLKEVARQWVATNYKVRACHNGDAEAMYERFKEALADAIGDGLNITEYQGFANAEQFHREHWGRTGFSQQGAGTRSNYAKDLWARDRGNGAGVKEGPVLAALRRELLEHPDARRLFSANDIPTEKVDLLEFLKQRRLAGEVLQVADDDNTEAAELRRLKKLFKLKPTDDASEELKVLVTVFQFVRGLPEEELELLDLTRSPKLRSVPKVARESGGGLEVIGIKRAAAAQMTIECTGSPQKTALALVLSHWCGARMRMRMRMFLCVRGDVCAHVSTSACTCACTLSIHTSTYTCVQVPLLVWAKGGRHCVTHINLALDRREGDDHKDKAQGSHS